MRYLKSIFINVPDQVVSTLFIWGGIFFFYRGFKSILEDLPSASTLLWVIFIGIGLGLIVSWTQRNTNEKDTKIPQLGK